METTFASIAFSHQLFQPPFQPQKKTFFCQRFPPWIRKKCANAQLRLRKKVLPINTTKNIKMWIKPKLLPPLFYPHFNILQQQRQRKNKPYFFLWPTLLETISKTIITIQKQIICSILYILNYCRKLMSEWKKKRVAQTHWLSYV